MRFVDAFLPHDSALYVAPPLFFLRCHTKGPLIVVSCASMSRSIKESVRLRAKKSALFCTWNLEDFDGTHPGYFFALSFPFESLVILQHDLHYVHVIKHKLSNYAFLFHFASLKYAGIFSCTPSDAHKQRLAIFHSHIFRMFDKICWMHD